MARLRFAVTISGMSTKRSRRGYDPGRFWLWCLLAVMPVQVLMLSLVLPWLAVPATLSLVACGILAARERRRPLHTQTHLLDCLVVAVTADGETAAINVIPARHLRDTIHDGVVHKRLEYAPLAQTVELAIEARDHAELHDVASWWIADGTSVDVLLDELTSPRSCDRVVSLAAEDVSVTLKGN